MNKITNVLSILLAIMLTACASVPKPLTTNPNLPKEYPSVGYKENYWAPFFEHIATFSIQSDRIILLDEDVNMTLLFSNMISIEYDKPFFTDPNNYIVITYTEKKDMKKAYFTLLKNFGWTPGTSEIFQTLIYAYEKK